MKSKTYNDMLSFSTFLERFEYLRLYGSVGKETFGFDRYLNQSFYRSKEWRTFRRDIIVRDNGCDLGIDDREIRDRIIIHHINPITVDDVINRSEKLLDPNNVVCVSSITHEAIHYGDSSLLFLEPIERKLNDTCPWKTERLYHEKL